MGFLCFHTLKSLRRGQKNDREIRPIRRSIFHRLEFASLEDRIVPSSIVNGGFDQGANNLGGWVVSDPSYVAVNAGHQAVISESPVDTEVDLYQDFTVPQGAQSLSFTFQVLGAPSVPSGDTPDAFGASLLNPQSLQPLVNTVNATTDSYYVQDVEQGVTQGQAASGVTVTSGTASGTSVITLDVSALGGDSARILFRLIGGSDVTGLGAVGVTDVSITGTRLTVFTGLQSPTITYGTTTTTLSGTVGSSGGVFPSQGETVDVTIDGQLSSTTVFDNSGDFSLNFPTSTIPVSGSPYTITYSYAGHSNLFAGTDDSTTLTVNPAPITVTANAQTKVHGTLDPLLNYQITSGALVGTDQFSGSLTRVAGENVGSYAIQQGTLTAGNNYNLTYIGANLSITAAPITVTANAQTKVYGTLDPALTYQITSGALVGTDQFSGSLTRVAGENVGSYAIQQGTLTAGNNYNLTYIGANLSITAAPITVTANAQTKVYGTSDPALTYQITSGALVGTDQFSDSLTRVAGENVGSYAIQQGTLTAGNNYNLTYIGANLSITAAPITVTANAQTKVYGTSDPALTYQITSGALVGTDQFSGSLTRVAGENVGSYAIQQGTLTAGNNYNLTYIGANLSITAAPITVTANAQTKVYGTSDPALTYQITSGALAGADQFSGGLTRVAGENVGSYAIQQGTLTAGNNYNLTYIGANLSITAVAQPAANPQSVTTAQDTTTAVTLTGSDPNTPPLTLAYTVTTNPAHGTLSGTAPDLTYTPATGYFGADSFQFADNNGVATSSPATVSITVVGQPTANAQSVTTAQGVAAPVTLTGTDPNTPPLTLTYIVTADPAHGTLTGTAPDLTYNPTAGYSGADSVQFKVYNGTLDSSVATVSITVKSLFQPPISNDDRYTTTQNNSLTVAAPGVLANDTTDGGALTAVLLGGPSHGTLTLSSDGSFTYTPSQNFTGSDSFTYLAVAGTVQGNVGVVHLNITPLSTRILPDTRHYNYLRARRSIDPTRFDFYHAQLGTLLGLEISGIPTKRTTLVPSNAHFNATAERKRYAQDPARFDARDPVLGALFQLESPAAGPPPIYLLPINSHFNALRAQYDQDPAQFQRKNPEIGAVIALEHIENGGRSAPLTSIAQASSTAPISGAVHPAKAARAFRLRGV